MTSGKQMAETALPARVQGRWRDTQNELALVVRRATNQPAAERALGARHFRLGAYATTNAAESIYQTLRDEVAAPALRRFERPDRGAPARGKSMAPTTRAPTMTSEPPLFDDLRAHLRVEAHVLAQRGLDADKVRHRLDALFRHEHPGISLRSLRIGLVRDALPFALGSTLLSSLADVVDPRRTQSLMWPPVEALGVVLVNLIGMARFNATNPALRSRLAHVTPSQALEALRVTLRNPVRDVAGHVVGFVFCYGVLRNLARLAMEAGLSAAAPGVMSHRFGSTIHAGLEILLAPVPGALLGPLIDRISLSPENARLELLLQDRFADLLCEFGNDGPRVANVPFWQTFWAEFAGLLCSGAPKAIWLTLTLGFYFLTTLHADASTANDDPDFDAAMSLAANATATPPTVDATSEGVDWHTQAVLSVLYGLIATAVALQGISTRHDALCTAYTRRRGRPKVSTITVASQGDSGHSSTGSHSDVSPSPAGLSDDAFGNAGGHPADCGDTSGDESVFLPMDDAGSASSHGSRGSRGPQTRRQGTFVPPSDLAHHGSPGNAVSDGDYHTAL